MSNINTRLSTHSGKLERWLGRAKIEEVSTSMRGWYGRPISCLDVPGRVRIGADGDFVGTIERGSYFGILDALERAAKCAGHVPKATFHAGFSSISDALSRASQGFSQRRNFLKNGSTGVTAATSSLWRVGAQPIGGAVPAAAGAGTAFDSTSVGALAFANPAVGTNRLVGAELGCSTGGNCLLIFDLLYGVDKTMNSTATEAVTGVPTRYQSSIPTAEDYAGDNFLFIQVGGTALAATAHSWTVCLYRNQAGTDNQTLPSVTGAPSAIIDRLDHPTTQWFAPLASGDTGIMDLAQMQCSAAVLTGEIWFMIGHPIGFMFCNAVNNTLPFDWLTNREQAPRIFNNACLAFLEIIKPSPTATNYTGRIITTSTSS